MSTPKESIGNKNNIKVCHMTSAHPRYDQRILYRECVSLYDAGYDITLLVNDEMENETIKGVNIKSTKRNFKGKRFKRMLSGVNEIYKMAKKEDADIYHFHDPELMRIATRLKRKGKVVVYDSHEIYYLQIKEKNYLPKLIRNLIAKIYVWYENYVLKRIDGVIFPVKTDKIDFGSKTKRVAYVNNMPRNDELPSIQEKNSIEQCLCYTGGLTYARGIYQLAEAAHIAGIPLYLAGVFESDEFKNKILGNNEDNMVRYLGVLSREEVYRLYQKCTIGVSTLLKIGQYAIMDNLPTKVYEYMAIGLPVILSDIPYNRSVIEEYGIGMLVNPDQPEDIAEKITYLLAHPDEMKAMGEKGKQLVLTEWNWSKEEEKLLWLYKEILEK